MAATHDSIGSKRNEGSLGRSVVGFPNMNLASAAPCILGAALLCMSVLSACVESHAPETGSPPVAEATSSYALDPESPDPGEPVESPAFTPDEVAHRIPRLINSVRGQQDLSPANVERIAGIKVHVDTDAPDSYGFNGEVGAG
jgi:hypothetical protein